MLAFAAFLFADDGFDGFGSSLPVPEGLAVDMGAKADYSAQLGRPYAAALAGYSYGSDIFDMAASLEYLNDGKYTPSESWMSRVGGLYMVMNEGYTRLKFDNLAFTAGYLKAHGTVDTPYDSYINGNHIGSLGADISYKNGGFSYESRWISVNLNSRWAYGADYGSLSGKQWEDRGANYRSFSYAWGNLRLGYEESALYIGRPFDPLYFFSPMPAILTNTLINQTTSNPWVQNSNDNSMMGLFSEYKTEDLYLEAQFCVDDINIPYFLKYNEDKFAWSLGGSWDSSYGKFSFYHGGATQFTYESTYAGVGTVNAYPYQYTYFPLSTAPTPGSADTSNSDLLDITDNSIGFMYGENSLAFKFGYQNRILPDFLGGLDFAAHFEYVLNGIKSPDNPWQAYENDTQIPYRIGLFREDGVLEQRMIADASANAKLGDLRIGLGIMIGEILNRLAVVPVVAGEPSMYVPQAGKNQFVFELALSLKYAFAVPE
jgi:hypothetical protein